MLVKEKLVIQGLLKNKIKCFCLKGAAIEGTGFYMPIEKKNNNIFEPIFTKMKE